MKLAIILSAVILLVGYCMGRDTGSAAQSSAVPIIKPGNGEPVVTLAAPTPVVLPTPAITERVRFDAGAYGATLTGSASQAYTLWARSGQEFSAYTSTEGTAYMRLENTEQVIFDQVQPGQLAKVMLPTDGDYTLTVYASGTYTTGVEIR